MPKVYVATEGSYSDFHVVGVFSTKEKADEWAAAHKGVRGDLTGIEEYELDELPVPLPHMVWTCRIDLDTGTISNEETYLSLGATGDRGYANIWAGRNSGLATSYVSADHCRKIAAEFRQRCLRCEKLNRWGNLYFDEEGHPTDKGM